MTRRFAEKTTTRRALLLGSIAASAWFYLSPLQAAQSPQSPIERYVLQRGNEVIAAANAGSARRFRTLLRRHADVQAIATFALGNYASRLPSNRRREYYRLFEAWVGRKFKKHADALRGRTFEITSSHGGPRDYVVNGRVLGGGRMPVAFRVRKSGSRYSVRDVNIAGVWLRIVLRSSITRRLQQNGGDFNALFAYLR